MARKPNPSSVPYQTIEQLQAFAQANFTANKGMPENADHRALVIVALMGRIKKLSPAVYRVCEQSIKTIANFESLLFAYDARREIEILREIVTIDRGKVPRVTHYPPLLRQQRAALLDYFTQEKIDMRQTSSGRLLAIRDRWPRIVEVLTRLPCSCGNYDREYKEFNRRAKTDVVKTRNGMERRVDTPAELADLLLAHLHSLSFSQLRKLLKPSV
jgi:hypothetical protein